MNDVEFQYVMDVYTPTERPQQALLNPDDTCSAVMDDFFSDCQ